MRENKPVLQAVMFEEGVLAIQYIDVNDIKGNGAQIHKTVFVPRDDDYDDEISNIEEAVMYLIADIAEDWPSLKSAEQMKRTTPDEEEDDDA